MEPVAAAPARLIRWGGLSALLYLAGITLRYPLIPGLADPYGNWATQVQPSALNIVLHCLVYVALTLVYLLAVREAARAGTSPDSTRAVVVGWLAASLALIGAYGGGESHDSFDYTFRARMFLMTGASPLAVTPDTYPSAPFFDYIAWDRHVDTYGPLWEYLSIAVGWLVGHVLRALGMEQQVWLACPAAPGACDALALYLVGYRLLAIGLAGVAGWLIVAIVRQRAPQHASLALLIWLWNPVLLIGTALGAHNDGLMLVLMLMSCWCVQRQRWFLAIFWLGMAAHVKLTALLLAPALAVWMIRRAGWQRSLVVALAGAGVLMPLSWLMYLPLGGWQTLPRMLHERGLYFANSLAAVLYRWVYTELGWGWPDAVSFTNRASMLAYALLLALLLWRLWRGWRQQPSIERYWVAQLGVMLAYLAVGSFWFQHWYLLWALVLAALVPRHRLSQVVMPWYGCGALCANLVTGMLGAIPALRLTPLHLAIIATLLALVPLLVSLAVAWGDRRSAPALAAPAD